MTGSNTEKVQVPRHLQACVVLHRIAAMLFYAAGFDKNPLISDRDRAFVAWKNLRDAAALIAMKRVIAFSPMEWEGILDALRFSHTLHHGHPYPAPRELVLELDQCNCELADLTAEVQFLLVTNNAEVPCAAA